MSRKEEIRISDEQMIIEIRDAMCSYSNCPVDGCDNCIFDAPKDEFALWLKEYIMTNKK